MLALHRRMFGDVWTWAGTLRRRVTNIGAEPALIATQSQLMLDDATFWHAEEVFGSDEFGGSDPLSVGQHPSLQERQRSLHADDG